MLLLYTSLLTPPNSNDCSHMLSPLIDYGHLFVALPASQTVCICFRAPLQCLNCANSAVAMCYVEMHPWLTWLHTCAGKHGINLAEQMTAAEVRVSDLCVDDVGPRPQNVCNLGCRRLAMTVP